MINYLLFSFCIEFIPGKPWVMQEAFQLLLKAQVNKLIEMGFNPQLKVGCIFRWFPVYYCESLFTFGFWQ